jgi:hypothetical protein
MQCAHRRISKALGCLVLFLLFVAVSWSQATQQFTGRVLDSTGAVVPGAQVIVHNQATGVDVKAVTASSGDYMVPYLIPGTYDIAVSKEGFRAEKKTGILLNVSQTSTIDFQLNVGTATEVITVDASAVQIELSKSDRGEVIDSERVAEMPLDGRNPFGLVSQSAGVHDFSNSQYPRPYDNVTGNQYVNGSPQVSQTNIDGMGNDASDLGRTAFTPSVDVVQEFKLILNAYDASYGHSGGSSMDVALKSGGNQYHGIADYYMRRRWLDAYDWQSKYNDVSNPSKPPHKRDQYSFELEGPVVIPHVFNGRNKLFFVASYEEMKDILPNPSYNTYSMPNTDWLKGDFSTATYWNTTTNSLQPLTIYDPLTPLQTVVDPIDGKTKQAHSAFAGNRIPTSRIDTVAANIVSYYSYFKANVDPGSGYAPYANNYQNLQVEHDLWRNAMFKVDYNLSDKDKFSFRWGGQGRWMTANWNTGAPNDDPAHSNGSGAAPQSETGTVQWTHIVNSNLVTNLGVSLMTYNNRQDEGMTTSNNIVEALGFTSSYYNQLGNNHHFPYIALSGLPNSASYVDFGANWLGYSGVRHSLDFLPAVTYNHGAHTIRAGVNIDFFQWLNPFGGNADNYHFDTTFSQQYYNSSDAPGYSSGLSIASLLLGYPNYGSVNANVHQFWSQHYFAPWVQDDWKLTKKLTLNLGLRWDFLTAETERHNKATGYFDTTVLNPVSSQIPTGSTALGSATNLQGGLTYAGVNGVRRGAYATNMLHVQPRIGFAYAINSKMSLRGGIGETYMTDQSTNNADGFSASTSYNNSLDNGITPYTSTTGQGFSNPISVVLQPTGSSRGYKEDLGSSITYVNPQFNVPSLWSYSLIYEVALTSHDVLSIGYVGNRVPNNSVSDNINHVSAQWNAQCDIERGGNRHICDDTATGQVTNPFRGVSDFSGTGYYTNDTISKGTLTRPYPEFTDITENGATNNGKSWYNSLQVSASHQVNRSLSLHGSYTHAKSESSGGWLDTVNRVWARQVSTSNDVNHSITFSGVGYLPFGRGRLLLPNANTLVDEIVNGWEIAPIFSYYSGFAWRPTDSGGSGGLYDSAGNWEMASTGEAINTSMGVNHTILPADGNHKDKRLRGVTPCVGYKDADTGAIISSPAATAAGCTSIQFVRMPTSGYSVGRANIDFGVREPGAYKFDMAVSKNFKIPGASKVYLSDSTSLQLRADLLNVFNHANWDLSYNNDPTSIDFGTIGKGPSGPSNTPRYMQLSARLSW